MLRLHHLSSFLVTASFVTKHKEFFDTEFHFSKASLPHSESLTAKATKGEEEEEEEQEEEKDEEEDGEENDDGKRKTS